MLSLNIDDNLSINDYSLSRETTPLPTSPTPIPLSPLHIPTNRDVPEIVLTMTDEECPQVDTETDTMKLPTLHFQKGNFGRIRLDSELSENTHSFASSEMNLTDNIFFSDEESSNYSDKATSDIGTRNSKSELRPPNTQHADSISQTEHPVNPPELHKARSENNLASTSYTGRSSFRAKAGTEFSKRRGSIFSQLSSKLAIYDADGNVQVYNKRCLPKSIHASIKGALILRDPKAQMRRRERTEVKTAQKSSYIVLLFVLLWLPLPIIVAFTRYYVTHGNEHEKVKMMLDFQVCAFCFGTLSATANPVIYGLAIKKFRRAFLKLIAFHKQKIVKRWKPTI
jgi:hypothetical protein